MTIIYVKKLERTGNEKVEYASCGTLKQTDKYQTGVAVLKKKDGKYISVPLYSWDLSGEALSIVSEGKSDKLGDVDLDESRFSKVVEIFPIVSGNEIELMSFLRLYKDKYRVLPELIMELLRSGLLDFSFESYACVPVFKYN